MSLMRAMILESGAASSSSRSEEHTSELQSRQYLVCRLLLEKKKTQVTFTAPSPNELACTSLGLGRAIVTSPTASTTAHASLTPPTTSLALPDEMRTPLNSRK